MEKKLNTDRFGWDKWNDNAGGIDGKAAHVPIDIEHELAQINNAATIHNFGKGLPEGGEQPALEAIAEGCSDEEDDESSLENDQEEDDIDGQEALPKYSNRKDVKLSDYLQAFTHFMYRFTNKKVMVCDLQGVYNTDTTPPTFELSDPAIHYASTSGRTEVYGRTDKWKKGMDLFFKTHQCSEVCRSLRLSGKNKKWEKDWCRHHESKLASLI